MPMPSVEQLREKETSLKQTLADQGTASDVAKRRALGKKLRRTQRKRRKALVVAERSAATAKAAAGDEPAAETKSE